MSTSCGHCTRFVLFFLFIAHHKLENKKKTYSSKFIISTYESFENSNRLYFYFFCLANGPHFHVEINRLNIANNMKLSRIRSVSRSSRIRSNTSLTTMRNSRKEKPPIQWDWINLPICDQKNVSAVAHWRNRKQTDTIHSFQSIDKKLCNLSDLFFYVFRWY